MIKRLKCWLIKRLGGKTKTEWENAVYSGLVSSQRAKKYKKNYEEEHEAYLALLNLHNATAEAAQSNNAGVSGAIDTIKAYCSSKNYCGECALYNENSGCKIHEIPCYWGMSE